MSSKFASVDEYIASFPPEVVAILKRLRETLAAAVPGSDETIRYDMPAVMSNGGYVVHYAGWKKHIGLYPIPRFEPDLEAEIAPYRAVKDTIRLPLNKPIPYDLMARMTAAIAAIRAAES